MSAHLHDQLTADLSATSFPAAEPKRGWLAAAFALPVFAWREIRLRRAARKLEGLDDRMLGDIGISRADIDTAVRSGRRFPVPYL